MGSKYSRNRWGEKLEGSLRRVGSKKKLIEIYKEKRERKKVRRCTGSGKPFPKGDPRRSKKFRRNMPKAYYNWAIKELSS